MALQRYPLAISFANTSYKGGWFCTANPVTIKILLRTEIGKQAEGIVTAGGLLPDDMMLDLITTKLDTLKDTASILCTFIPYTAHATLYRIGF